MSIGQTIGKTMNNGFAGSYSRQPDQIIDPHAAGGEINFGDVVAYNNGKVVTIPTLMLQVSTLTASTLQASEFVGIATRETKSATSYLNQNVGSYVEGEAVPVMKRGRVNVICQNGTPALNGDVYMRTDTNSSYPNAVVGGLEAAEDAGKTVKLTNAKWRGAADGNGVAELSILTQLNA
jgi:hypothetical protein